MERIERLQAHLSTSSTPIANTPNVYLSPRDNAMQLGVYETVLTTQAVAFVVDVAIHFAGDIAKLHQQRKLRRLETEQNPDAFPTFLESSKNIRDDLSWTIDPLPRALHDRRVDIGDVAPCDRKFLLQSLNCGAQGVQVDFDDGNCPTWRNVLCGHSNIMDAVRGTLRVGNEVVREDGRAALLLVRPRAWNMDETNMVVNGRVVPGAIFDFALHIFHNGRLLVDNGRGPFLYLPKLESHHEAALWRRIFEFSEVKLNLPSGCIKSIVLIENIFAAFEMDEILYELRHHSAGLNCGMWDYTASIIVNFRHNTKCVLPDRQQYVSMKTPFLRYYMELLIRTCKRRNAPATTGMVPFVLEQLPPSLSRASAIEKAKAAKLFEAKAGSDGALVFDLELVEPVQEVFTGIRGDGTDLQQTSKANVDEDFYYEMLTTLPSGDVSLKSLELNLTVALRYCLAWFNGQGTVVVNGCVEDSATAEISRAQLWQWIHHQVPLVVKQSPTSPSPHRYVNTALVHDLLMAIAREELSKASPPLLRHIVAAINLVFRVITTRLPPPFMTTFLLEQEPLIKSLEQE